MILVVIVHADPSVRPQYEDALRARGIDAEVLCIVGKGTGLSSIYVQLAASARAAGGGSLLKGLFKMYAPKRSLGDYEHIVLATFSAGYAFARELVAADRAMLSGLVLLDSGHAALDKDGTAADAGVMWAVTWAQEARGWRKPFWIGHSDVDPVTYASTTKFAAEVVRLSGDELDELTVTADEHARGIVRKRAEGLFHVRAHNVNTDQMAEHRAALNGREKGGWGPTFVAEACSWLHGAFPAREPSLGRRIVDALVRAATWRPSTLGGHVLVARPLRERAVDVALEEMKRGATEDPIGSNAGPDIEEYLRYVTRDGQPGFKLTKGNYCAAGACWSFRRALGAGEQMPFPYRASGIEMTQDAQRAGTWRSGDDVRAGRYVLRVGDVVIFPRGKPGGWERHVVMVRTPIDAKSFVSIEANSPVGWSSQKRSTADLVGVVSVG